MTNPNARALVLLVAALVAGGSAASARPQDADSERYTATMLCVTAERALEDAEYEGRDDPERRKATRLAAIAKFEEAIPHWRAAGAAVSLAKTYARLGGLYGAWDTPEGERALESAYALWGELKRYREQASLLHTHGVWYARKHDYASAVERLLREADLRKGIPDPRGEARAYRMVAAIYERTGDDAKRAAYEAIAVRADRAASAAAAASADESWREPRPFVPLPDGWADFASSPLRSEVEVNEGLSSASLANRSGLGVSAYRIGCVAETNGRAHVLGALRSVSGLEGGFTAGGRDVGIFASIAEPATGRSDAPTRCDDGARTAVVEVVFEDGSTWSVEGEPWIVD